jgi:chromobox protein 5
VRGKRKTQEDTSNRGTTAPAAKRAKKTKLKDDPTWTVSAILDHKTSSGKHLYRVRWLGFAASDDTWEPEQNFSKDLIKQYWSEHKKKSGRGRKSNK